MRILVVSHFYPPILDGGYAQLCAEVCAGLQARGHHIDVLTSNYGIQGQTLQEQGIYRQLHLENDLNYFSASHFFRNWYRQETDNDRAIVEILQKTQPDIVFIWGMYGLSKSIPAKFEELVPGKVVYFISDVWPINPSFVETYWSTPAISSTGKVLKSMLKIPASGLLRLRSYPPALEFQRALIVSNAIKQNIIHEGVPIHDSLVIHSGINVEEYLYYREEQWLEPGQSLEFLYAGNLGHHKGIHTAIQAFGILHSKYAESRFRMVIAGEGHPDYENELRSLIHSLRLENQISMIGKVDRKEMPLLLRQFDVLLIPSECEDALPRIVQEAMMAGMVVIGSDRGGIPEMVLHKNTGLIFKSGDANDLAAAIHLLINDRSFASTLAINGQQKAVKEFSIETMVERVNEYLTQVVG